MSMLAWIVRATQLGIITESTAKNLFFDFSKQGWHDKEPGDAFPPEQPERMTRQVMQLVTEEIISESRAKELLGRSLADFRKDFSR